MSDDPRWNDDPRDREDGSRDLSQGTLAAGGRKSNAARTPSAIVRPVTSALSTVSSIGADAIFGASVIVCAGGGV
jgi:hypothetical protein